jgi:excinuclease UvrABC nuclease subunit
MGRCAAPCDGTVTIEHYHEIIQRSIAALLHPTDYQKTCETQMRQSAADLNFEQAGKIKTHLERHARLHAGQFSHLRSLSDFHFLSLQRGPGEKKSKLFLITPTRCEEILGLLGPDITWRRVLEYAQLRMSDLEPEFNLAAAEQIAIVASHLFSTKKQGVIIPWSDLTEKSLADAHKQLSKQKLEEESADEGVVKDLQVM